jgi:putative SOS response-associated peptidase YedK
MCGRFTQAYAWQQLIALYRLTIPASNLEPRCNIAPTTTIDTIISRDGKLELARMRWGLCPSWWKKTLKELPATFNARAEPVAEKPTYRARSSGLAA